jgi:hypothetical protein
MNHRGPQRAAEEQPEDILDRIAGFTGLGSDSGDSSAIRVAKLCVSARKRIGDRCPETLWSSVSSVVKNPELPCRGTSELLTYGRRALRFSRGKREVREGSRHRILTQSQQEYPISNLQSSMFKFETLNHEWTQMNTNRIEIL